MQKVIKLTAHFVSERKKVNSSLKITEALIIMIIKIIKAEIILFCFLGNVHLHKKIIN